MYMCDRGLYVLVVIERWWKSGYGLFCMVWLYRIVEGGYGNWVMEGGYGDILLNWWLFMSMAQFGLMDWLEG